MDKSRVYEIISAFRNAIESRGIKADKLILFGSYATGQYSQDSDIGIVVISRDFQNKSIGKESTYFQTPFTFFLSR